MNARIDHCNIPSAIANQLGWMPYTLKYNPDTKHLDKKPSLRGWADSTDSLDLCLWKCRNNPDWLPGLSLNPKVNGIALIDFDNVGIGEGNFTAEAMGYVNKAQTLSEVSASGNGIHLLITAKVDKNYKHKYLLNQAGTCELYWEKRFAALTFDWRLDVPQTLNDYQYSLESIFPFVEVSKRKYGDYTNLGDDLFYGNAPKYIITEKPLAGIMEQLRRAKNNSKSSKLIQGSYIYNGEWLGSESYPSQSEADLALVALCMFYAKSPYFLSRYYPKLDDYCLRGLAYSLTDMVLKKSSLFRSKWRRRDYKISTLSLGYDSQIRTYFDEQSRDEFSDTQRARQGLSANKRMANNQRKILDAIDTLSKSMDKVTQSAIVSHTGISINAVRRNLLALDFDLSHLSPIH